MPTQHSTRLSFSRLGPPIALSAILLVACQERSDLSPAGHAQGHSERTDGIEQSLKHLEDEVRRLGAQLAQHEGTTAHEADCSEALARVLGLEEELLGLQSEIGQLAEAMASAGAGGKKAPLGTGEEEDVAPIDLARKAWSERTEDLDDLVVGDRQWTEFLLNRSAYAGRVGLVRGRYGDSGWFQPEDRSVQIWDSKGMNRFRIYLPDLSTTGAQRYLSNYRGDEQIEYAGVFVLDVKGRVAFYCFAMDPLAK